jgi:hypothetical protein
MLFDDVLLPIAIGSSIPCPHLSPLCQPCLHVLHLLLLFFIRFTRGVYQEFFKISVDCGCFSLQLLVVKLILLQISYSFEEFVSLLEVV